MQFCLNKLGSKPLFVLPVLQDSILNLDDRRLILLSENLLILDAFYEYI